MSEVPRAGELVCERACTRGGNSASSGRAACWIQVSDPRAESATQTRSFGRQDRKTGANLSDARRLKKVPKKRAVQAYAALRASRSSAEVAQQKARR